MLEAADLFLTDLFGLDRQGSDLLLRHMLWRTLVVLVVAVTLARLGARRFLSHNAGFDIMVAVVLGSVLSRAINGDARFFPTLGASALLLVLHRVLASMASQWHGFSQLVKGRAHVLVRNGEVDREEMARTKITDDDLDAALRLHGNVNRLEDVAEARLERSGAISVVPAGGTSGPPTRRTAVSARRPESLGRTRSHEGRSGHEVGGTDAD